MPFTQDTFSPVGAVSSAAPSVFAYSTADTIAQVLTADYFISKRPGLDEGDVVLCFASDGNFAGQINAARSGLVRIFESASNVCDLENFSIFAPGAPNQSDAVSGDNNRIITCTSLGVGNGSTSYGAANTGFQANQNQIIWLGEAEIDSQNIPFTIGQGPGQIDDSNVWFSMTLFDGISFSSIAGFVVAWSMPHSTGVEANALYDLADINTTNFIIDGLTLTSGFKVGFYYDVSLGKVYAATTTNTYELTILNTIVQANSLLPIFNITAGKVSNTQVGVLCRQSTTDTINAFPGSVPWCDAQFI